MQKYEEIHRNRKDIILNNFLGGIAWGLGATVGVSLVIALLSIIAHYINVIPIIGKFISDVIDVVLKTNHHFR